MSEYKLSALNIYPVKSLSGIALSESKVEERGLQYDRRWMIVDEENLFMTQRKYPQMVFIDVNIESGKLIFQHRIKTDQMEVSLSEFPQEKVKVKAWEDICEAVEYGKEINDWFTHMLEKKCKLVYMPDLTERKTSTKYFREIKNVSFADGYPFLIIGDESLNFLNSKLIKPMTMNQFRPNLVFSGGREHDEDSWKNIIIGNLKFSVGKPCARCVITTINPKNSKKEKEPLTTLSTYRKVNNKIMFGQNAIAHDEGTIKLGDKIIVESI